MASKALHDGSEIPGDLHKVWRQFELWRKNHKGRIPIPEELWGSAAQAARKHGVFRTAKILRLEYGKLKRMAEDASTRPTVRLVNTPLARRERSAPPAFVELMAAGAASLPEYTIELEGPNRKLRIHCKGATAADLAGLSQALLGVSS
jgi:hypothetical protein